jgi:PAB-dependent poly(A)-specific ribonuclease subunit 2
VDPQASIPVATTSVFDTHSDIVWVGDSSGYIASYVDNILVPYTRFAAHAKPIRQMLSHQKGVISTDGGSIRLTNRQGVQELLVGEKDCKELKDIKKIAFITPNEILIATGTALLRFDIAKNNFKVIMPYYGSVTLVSSHKRYIALGKENGTVDIFDHIDNTIIKTFNSHSATLSDIDLKEHRLVICGFTKRHGNFIADPMVQVYDIKTLSALPPISFPAGAAFVRLHPKLSSFAVISSNTGQIQVADMSKPASFSLYQVESCPSILSFELSSTGDYLSIIDGYSVLHLWCHSPEHAKMSNRTVPITYPDGPPPLALETNIDENSIPLNSVGLPYYNDQLLSAWPNHVVFKSAGTLNKPIDSEICKRSEQVGNIIIAPYDKDKYGRRNLAKKHVSLRNNSEHKKFLSNKNNGASTKQRKKLQEPDNIFEYKNDTLNSLPNAFKKLEIHYSKFGVDDFDFDSYNKTPFAGLESHVDNSYTNALLQLYRFVPHFFSFLISNLAVEDLEPSSLLRELGYLFDMLVKSHGKNFRPTNFQYALSNIEEANELGLIEKEGSGVRHNGDISTKLQLFNRFLLEKIRQDEIRVKLNSSVGINFDSIFGLEVETTLRTIYGNVINRDVRKVPALEVVFQPQSLRHGGSKPNQSIVQHIEAALTRIEQKSVLNERSGGYEMVESSRVVTFLPPVLSINLHLTNENKKHIRTVKDWLRPKFQAGFSKQGFILTDPVRDSKSSPSNANSSTSGFFKEYELIGFVAEISGEFEKDKHLVTFSKIPNETDDGYKWYLFNDFLVIEIPEVEVLNFSYWWKTPVSLVYKDTVYPSEFKYDSWRNGLDDGILYRDHFAAAIRESTKIEYELLTRDEAPKPGSLVAIDTEFVIVEQEQYEIKSNGTRLLLKPSTHALARVSILRGEGKKFGVPFIDDYVVVKEKVHDYLTSYSGIEPGDLDPETSDKPLVTREVAYRKIWLLVNLGCVFVGHGLTKDFRTINVCVPKSQIRDTSVFFYKGQRILSLRFLAYILLEKEVQVGNHDSIEDAMTALLIYREYLNFQKQGSFDEILHYIYQEGQHMKFKPPSEQR